MGYTRYYSTMEGKSISAEASWLNHPASCTAFLRNLNPIEISSNCPTSTIQADSRGQAQASVGPMRRIEDANSPNSPGFLHTPDVPAHQPYGFITMDYYKWNPTPGQKQNATFPTSNTRSFGPDFQELSLVLEIPKKSMSFS